MSKPFYIIMMGMPGSGKSTACEYLLSLQSGDHDKITYLSTDAYIESYATNHGVTYNEAFRDAIKSATTLMNRDLHHAFRSRKNIIHDQTNLSSRKRANIIGDIPSDYEIIGCFVTCDEDERQRRMRERIGKTVPVNVMSSMLMSLEYPSMVEGFNSLVIGPSDFIMSSLKGCLHPIQFDCV